MTEHTIIPAAEGDFFEMWPPLAQGGQLYVPIGIDSRRGGLVDAPLRIIGKTLVSHGGSMLGLVYSDAALLEGNVQYLAATPVEILKAFFFLTEVEGVSFNLVCNPVAGLPAYCADSPYSTTIDKALLARIIGGLLSGNFPRLAAEEHAEAAERCLWQDRLFEAFYHSVAARTAKASLDDFYFAEVDCLFGFGFFKQVDQYLRWYQGIGQHLLYQAVHARWLSLRGEHDSAHQWLEEIIQDKDYSYQAYYVRGLVHFKQQQLHEAITDFENCLKKAEHHHEARLGLGIALRNEGIKQNSSEMLKRAASHLLRVAKEEGYHAPEALAHLTALMLSLKNWEQAESFARRSLVLRDSKVTRNFLVQALTAQGRREEAAQFQN